MLDAYTMPNARAFSGASFSMPNSAVIDGIRRKLDESVGAVKSLSRPDYGLSVWTATQFQRESKMSTESDIWVGHPFGTLRISVVWLIAVAR
jgi:hypothetical protein